MNSLNCLIHMVESSVSVQAWWIYQKIYRILLKIHWKFISDTHEKLIESSLEYNPHSIRVPQKMSNSK